MGSVLFCASHGARGEGRGSDSGNVPLFPYAVLFATGGWRVCWPLNSWQGLPTHKQLGRKLTSEHNKLEIGSENSIGLCRREEISQRRPKYMVTTPMSPWSTPMLATAAAAVGKYTVNKRMSVALTWI